MGYVPNTEKERKEMLEAVGMSDIEALLADIPGEIRLREAIDLPPKLSELELKREMFSISERNSRPISFLGAGAYDHFIPSVVGHIVSRSEFYTSYTPYQAEASQGMLQSIYEFQTMVCALTGMEAANASMYDGASALAEAALMAIRVTKKKKVVVSRSVNPIYKEVLRTYVQGIGASVMEAPFNGGVTDITALSSMTDDSMAAVIVQQPNFFGCIEDLAAAGEAAHSKGAYFIAAVDPVSMGLLKPPGDLGADIVVGEGQSLGNPLSFGGPYLGFFACRQRDIRQMPGRLAGAVKDNSGRTGYCLTLQTREQHIKRERATSNICTNQALCALAATVHLSVMGKEGLRKAAELCLQKAHYAADRIRGIKGYSLPFSGQFFKEFVVRVPGNAGDLLKGLLKEGIIGGLGLGGYYPELKDHLLVCVTEKRTREEVDRLAETLGRTEGR